MSVVYYPAIIDRSASGYGVSFPDFPGVVAHGATVSDACVSAELALAFHVDAMAKDKDPIPDPSDYWSIEPIEGAADVAQVMIRVDVAAKVTRVLVSMDDKLLRAIDAVTTNRSAFLSEAARSALQAGRLGNPA